jgi:hypothetical protein
MKAATIVTTKIITPGAAAFAVYNVAHDAAGQIKDAVARNIMPRYGSLSATDKANIICWIESGVKNN